MKESEIENVKIVRVSWSRERGLTQLITVEGDGWGCSFGGWYLNGPACADWITQLMEVFDVWDNMDDKFLVGKVVRARTENGLIKAIGHPILDKWLDPEELFKKYRKEPK